MLNVVSKRFLKKSWPVTLALLLATPSLAALRQTNCANCDLLKVERVSPLQGASGDSVSLGINIASVLSRERSYPAPGQTVTSPLSAPFAGLNTRGIKAGEQVFHFLRPWGTFAQSSGTKMVSEDMVAPKFVVPMFNNVTGAFDMPQTGWSFFGPDTGESLMMLPIPAGGQQWL